MSVELVAPGEGFLKLPEQDRADASKPLVRIIPYGMEATVSYGGGTAAGPAAMIEASPQLELFDEELWCEPNRHFRIETLQEPDIPASPRAAIDLLSTLTDDALAQGAFPMTFGGEHSITPGAIAPFLKRYPDLALLHFDAHADLRNSYENDPLSHACAIRRCMDHEDLAVVSLGIRNISAEEIPFLEANQHRLTIHWAKDKANWDIDEILRPLMGRPVYLTFDVDGFDASLMPATGTPEPGGMFWDDVMPIIRAAAERTTIVGADINELAPQKGLHSCDFIAAKLAYKILGYKFALTTASLG